MKKWFIIAGATLVTLAGLSMGAIMLYHNKTTDK